MVMIGSHGRRIQRNSHGDTREVGGSVQIFTEKGWTPYPKGASDLIALALDHGWTVKAHGLPVRTNGDGDIIIAVILWRPAGWRPGGLKSPGFTIRVPWVCEHTAFRLGSILVKAHRRSWRELSSLVNVNRLIRDHQVPKNGHEVRI